MRGALGAALLAVACALGACSPSPRAERAEPASTTPEPIVTTAEEGLEVHWWIADDTDGAVGRALAEFAEPALPADSALRDAWALNGLRMVRAPALALDSVEARLPAVRMRQRQWVGWATRWTEVFRGRKAGGGTPLLVDAQRRSLPRGTMRTLVRCWPSFDAREANSAAGVARVEIAFQLHEVPDRSQEPAFSVPGVTAPEREGEVFRALTLAGVLEEGYIYIITGETPGVEWRAGAPTVRSGESREPERAGPDPLGPPVSAPLTLGEAMFTRRADENAGAPVKALLLLLPRAPETFRLLP